MPDYSKGKIYTLRSYQTDEIYIGSSINTLPKRLGKHKTDHKNWKIGKQNYITSFELIKYDDCYIELLELFPCNSKAELEKKEGEYIRSMNCVNKNIAGRTSKEYHKEWRKQNKEHHTEYNKQYYIDNIDKIKEQTKEYRIENADNIKEKNQKYQIENTDKIKEYKQEYYIKNADKLKEKCDCDCGGKYTKQHLSRHQNSKKHKEYLETLATN